MTKTSDAERFARAIALLDAANAEDPNEVSVVGEVGPKELVHAKRVTRWVEQLLPDCDEALRLAARAHHLRRWLRPRAQYPEGRAGYLRWRSELQDFHAQEAARILTACGYDATTIARVGALIRKRGLRSDPDAQALEDALCLVFIEAQLSAFAAQHSEERVLEILVKSLCKMSPAGRGAIASIGLDADGARLVAAASERHQSSGGSAGQDQEPPSSESSGADSA